MCEKTVPCLCPHADRMFLRREVETSTEAEETEKSEDISTPEAKARCAASEEATTKYTVSNAVGS